MPTRFPRAASPRRKRPASRPGTSRAERPPALPSPRIRTTGPMDHASPLAPVPFSAGHAAPAPRCPPAPAIAMCMSTTDASPPRRAPLLPPDASADDYRRLQRRLARSARYW